MVRALILIVPVSDKRTAETSDVCHLAGKLVYTSATLYLKTATH